MNRGAMVNQLVNGWAQSLAKERKLSVAFERIETDDKYMQAIRDSQGVKILLAKTSLLVSRVDEPSQMIEVDIPGRIPSAWQPDKGHNNYTLQIVVDAQIQPFITFNFFGWKIPGLTGPADVRLVGHSQWENLGRDPVTKEFYVNE